MIQSIMLDYRENPPKEIAGQKIESIIDYKFDETGLPKSDVIRFLLSDGSEAVVRPSGTEPKIKVYLTTVTGEHQAFSLMREMRDSFDSHIMS